ncbi:MAG TPA: hypothetical protein VLT36_02640, partial [Candidatus Dormibacteraeota bacterium]|nr:hypothetical protein [Candidatus Dormibacteraeota bacterium]
GENVGGYRRLNGVVTGGYRRLNGVVTGGYRRLNGLVTGGWTKLDEAGKGGTKRDRAKKTRRRELPRTAERGRDFRVT